MIESVKELFIAAAGKYLSEVDAAPEGKSNQHEIGGLVQAGLGKVLGQGNDTYKFECKFALLPGDDSQDDLPVITDGLVSWYDTRRYAKNRSPEYRLYYESNEVTELMEAGHLAVVAVKHDHSLLMLFAPPDTSSETQLRYLFGLDDLTDRMKSANMPDNTLILPIKLLLEEIGINPVQDEQVENDLDLLISKFPAGLPKTSELSLMARELSDSDAIDEPDLALTTWMEREEALFRAYEKHIVSEKLSVGFGQDGRDVDEFISFSLSVQNRRKSRVGHAFEHHLTALFEINGLVFERGKGKLYTEGKSQPDWIFPSFTHYHNLHFPIQKLAVLGAKTTCKDRWRQVLAEADRVEKKYLVTLEAGISEHQTHEMEEKHLQLIVPSSVHPSYTSNQQKYLYSLDDFIREVQTKSSL